MKRWLELVGMALQGWGLSMMYYAPKVGDGFAAAPIQSGFFFCLSGFFLAMASREYSK